MRDDFEAALLHIVAPRLQRLGYVYAATPHRDDDLFGFGKLLDEDTQVVIQFQRQADPARDHFTVNVLRIPADKAHPRSIGDAQTRAARLGYVLWYVYDLREYPVSDYWWTATDKAQLAVALLDAAEKIVQYGVPWAEDAGAPRPWEMPLSRVDEFGAAVQAVLADEMARLGYRLQRQPLAGAVPYCYFSKALLDGAYALIELQAIYSLDPGEFNFDVRLQHHADDDPLAFDGNYGQWRSISLAQLAWQTRGGAPLDRLAVSDVKTLFWRYRNRAELDAQLRDAMAQLKDIGCAWVEQTAEDDTIREEEEGL
jgi:hypothetical protein